MKIKRTQAQAYLQEFDLTSLFIEELLWDYIDIADISLTINQQN